MYTFPGIRPFIAAASDRRGTDDRQRLNAEKLWHVRQCQTMLGQLPPQTPAVRAELLGHVMKVRESLALALDACDDAIRDACRNVGIPAPGSLPEPKRKAKHGLHRADDRRIRPDVGEPEGEGVRDLREDAG